MTRRNQIVRQRSRLKTVIQSILHSHLIPSCPHADLCGAKGRTWLIAQVVPQDERLAIDRHLREFDRLGEDLQVIERDLARSALEDEGVKRLMTIPGVDITVALAMKAAIGDVSRFDDPQKLDLSRVEPKRPTVRPGPAYHGRITKQGRGHARGMLVEAVWAAARAPGPLRAFSLRRASPARTACRGRGNRTQTLCRDLASVDEGRELRVGSTLPACQEACAMWNSRPGARLCAAKSEPRTPTT